jgi:molybdopterin-binding protein
MKYGARNQITAKVTDVKRGDVMSLAKFEMAVPAAMASVITTESLDDLAMKPGDTVRLVIKAIHRGVDVDCFDATGVEVAMTNKGKTKYSLSKYVLYIKHICCN